jgi:hypothetical protein
LELIAQLRNHSPMVKVELCTRLVDVEFSPKREHKHPNIPVTIVLPKPAVKECPNYLFKHCR